MNDGAVRPLVGARRAAGERSSHVPRVLLLGLALVGLISLLYLTQTSDVATTGYDIQSLEAEKARWQMRNDQLRLQISELRSLDRIEREAQARLRMGPPEKPVFVPVDLSAISDGTRYVPEGTAENGSIFQRIVGVPGAVLSWLRGE